MSQGVLAGLVLAGGMWAAASVLLAALWAAAALAGRAVKRLCARLRRRRPIVIPVVLDLRRPARRR